MRVERTIDAVIEAGWHVLDTDFDGVALANWRRRAYDCVNALLGPEHRHTQYFKNHLENRVQAAATDKGWKRRGIETPARDADEQGEPPLAT